MIEMSRMQKHEDPSVQLRCYSTVLAACQNTQNTDTKPLLNNLVIVTVAFSCTLSACSLLCSFSEFLIVF